MRQAELADLVRDALAVLNEDQKLAVLLNKFEEMSYAEIADVMGRSPAAVKSLLARARTQLREQLEPYLLTGQRDSTEAERRFAMQRSSKLGSRSQVVANDFLPVLPRWQAIAWLLRVWAKFHGGGWHLTAMHWMLWCSLGHALFAVLRAQKHRCAKYAAVAF